MVILETETLESILTVGHRHLTAYLVLSFTFAQVPFLMSNNPVESHYVSLPRDDENLAFNGELYKSRDTKRIIFWYRGFIVCQNLAIFAIVIIIWSKYYRSHGSTCSQIVYCMPLLSLIIISVSEVSHSAAPAQHLLEYYPVRFSSGFGNMTTLYQAPPSNAVDEAWSDLYNGTLSIFWLARFIILELSYFPGFGISEIPEEEAQRLFTRTVPNTNGQYLIGLSVFHELHCLVSLLIFPQLDETAQFSLRIP